MAIYGDRRVRGHVICGGVELPPPHGDGAAVREALDLGDDEPVIFSLQRLGPEKRVDVLLHAFRCCLGRTGHGTLIIGGKGPEERKLRALADELGMEKSVRFVGYIPRDTLPNYFVACNMFAFHSTFETFGLVVAQAMSYGRAVVTVRNTALPEVVGDAGLMAETGDWRGLGDAMARLIRDEPLRRQLGEAGRVRAERLFNWDRIAEQYETVLTRAAGENKRGH